jgi:plastocyanin
MLGMENMVSWRDYEGVEGFGSASQADVDQLNKALTAGQEINPPGTVTAGDGFALRVESLEQTLKNTTFKMDHVRLWRSIPKLAAYNTVEEHNVISGYGDNPDAGWIDEGDLPNESDSTYERQFAVVKYLGTTRRVSHVMSLVKPAHGNVIAQETVNGTMHLLRMLERALFYGDSNLLGLQFDGYERLMLDNSPSSNIIDMRGAPLSEDILTDACLTASDAPNYGRITHAHMNPKVHSDLVKTFFPKERHDTFQKVGDYVGLDIKGFTSPAGPVSFEPNVFIDQGLRGPNSAAIGPAASRPGTPTVTTGATTPAAGASQFTADDAGDYYYVIVAVNRYGKSAPVDLAAGPAAVTVAAGDEVTWEMTPGGTTDVDYYEVYRTKVGGASGTEKLILRVNNTAGAGALAFHDYNASLPDTTSVFMFQQNLECLSYKQLAPMVKIPLATIDSSIRWMQLVYGVPVLYTPGKVVLIQNVGRAEGYVGAA